MRRKRIPIIPINLNQLQMPKMETNIIHRSPVMNTLGAPVKRAGLVVNEPGFPRLVKAHGAIMLPEDDNPESWEALGAVDILGDAIEETLDEVVTVGVATWGAVYVAVDEFGHVEDSKDSEVWHLKIELVWLSRVGGRFDRELTSHKCSNLSWTSTNASSSN